MAFYSSKPIAMAIIGLISFLFVTSVRAQTADPASAHGTQAPSDTPPPAASSVDSSKMQQEIARLREQVRQLEQRMQPTANRSMQQGGRMGAMRKQSQGVMSQTKSGMKMGMRMMDHDMDMSMGSGPSMSMPAGGRMGLMMEDEMMGMGAMGGMNSPAAMATPSALPGFPGQSHLYHIGATDFFLDHLQHITLTRQQQQALAQQKQQSLVKQGELQRQSDAAEQELWQLTASDQPQSGSIEKKVREIERLRGDRRIAFIRSIGEATKVLTDEQRMQLTGMAPAPPMNDQSGTSMPDSGKKDRMGHM